MGCTVSYGPGTPQGTPDHKATDIGVEGVKQLITLSVGVLALTVTFLKDILGDSRDSLAWAFLLPLSWFFLLLALYSGIAALAQAARVLGDGYSGYVFDRNAPAPFRKKGLFESLSSKRLRTDNKALPVRKGFSARGLAYAAQRFFLFALVLLVVFAWRNLPALTKRPSQSEDSKVKIIEITGPPGKDGKDGKDARDARDGKDGKDGKDHDNLPGLPGVSVAFGSLSGKFSVLDIGKFTLDLGGFSWAWSTTKVEINYANTASTTISGNALFEYGKATLTSQASAVLNAVLNKIPENPIEVRIEGYTDARGNDDYNLRLSMQRAKEVKKWFLAHTNLLPQTVTTSGHGKNDPAVPTAKDDGSDDPVNRALNRRVRITYPARQ